MSNERRIKKLEKIIGQKKKGPDKVIFRIQGTNRTVEFEVRNRGDYEKSLRKIEKT